MKRSRLVTAAALAVLVAALAGCVRISGTVPSQPASMGPVTLTVNFCANQSPGCSGATNAPAIYTFLTGSTPVDETFDSQLLFAVRLPAGATPADPPVAGGLSWSRSTSYEAELQTFEPAPAGSRWWGWISAPFSYSRFSQQTGSVSIEVDLPRPAGGAPSPPAFQWRPVIGTRYGQVPAQPALPPGRPVDCGNTNGDLYAGYTEPPQFQGSNSQTTVCIDSPDPDAARGFLVAPVTDFGVTGAGATVPASGGTISVPFVIQRSGPENPLDNLSEFSLTVGGGPPGATTSLSRTSAPLAAAATPVIATVTVPPGTPAGEHPLTLTAQAPGKPARSGQAVVTVQAAPAPPPPPPADPAPTPPPADPPAPPAAPDTTAPLIQAVRLSQATLRRTIRKPVTLTVRSGEGGRATVLVQRLRPGRRAGSVCRVGARAGRPCVVVRRVRALARPTAGTVAFRLAGTGVPRLAPGRYRAEIRVTDAAGNRSLPRRVGFTVRP